MGSLVGGIQLGAGKIAKGVMSMAAGGAAAAAAGGKFANGAVSAAFVYMFNEIGDAFIEQQQRWRFHNKNNSLRHRLSARGNYGGEGYAGENEFPNPADSPFSPVNQTDAGARQHDIGYYKHGLKYDRSGTEPARLETDRIFVNSVNRATDIHSIPDRLYREGINILFSRGSDVQVDGP